MNKIIRNDIFRLTNSVWSIVVFFIFIVSIIGVITASINPDCIGTAGLINTETDVFWNKLMSGDTSVDLFSYQAFDSLNKILTNVYIVCAIFCFVITVWFIGSDISSKQVGNMLIVGNTRLSILMGKLLSSFIVTLTLSALSFLLIIIMSRILMFHLFFCYEYIIRFVVTSVLIIFSINSIGLAFVASNKKYGKGVVASVLAIAILSSVCIYYTHDEERYNTGFGFYVFTDTDTENYKVFGPFSKQPELMEKIENAQAYEMVYKDGTEYMIIDNEVIEGNEIYPNPNYKTGLNRFMYRTFVLEHPFALLAEANIYAYSNLDFYIAINDFFPMWCIQNLLLITISNLIGYQIFKKKDI